LSQVRVHTGGDAAGSAKQLGAKAFTVGSDVHFAAGAFAPGTGEGDRLLAHELAHTLQGGDQVRCMAEDGSRDAHPDEAQADAALPDAPENLGDLEQKLAALAQRPVAGKTQPGAPLRVYLQVQTRLNRKKREAQRPPRPPNLPVPDFNAPEPAEEPAEEEPLQ